MTWEQIKQNWPKWTAMLIANVLILFALACPPTTQSLIQKDKKITRPELQLELDTIIATARLRKADLDKQQAIRDIILKNALVMVETGTFNPLGVLSALFAFYGIGSAATKTRAAIKKAKNRKNSQKKTVED